MKLILILGAIFLSLRIGIWMLDRAAAKLGAAIEDRKGDQP